MRFSEIKRHLKNAIETQPQTLVYEGVNIMTDQQTATQTFDDISKDVLIDVERSAKAAADAASYFLKNAGLEAYKRFLNEMYHYTRFSGEKLKIAYGMIEEPEIKALFKEFFDDEELHYRLAAKDLEAFGLKPTEAQSENVDAIDQLWMSMLGKPNEGYLAIMFVFENIAKHVQKNVDAFVKRLGLTETNARWLIVHAEADIEHGQMIHDILVKHAHKNPSVVITAARKASALWSTMMVDLIDDSDYATKKAA